jgi:CRISPR-associated endoribonuclease Cas6
MRFQLTLTTTDRFPELTLNYQYPLSAVIYKILQRADAAYALFLHEQGYRHGSKTFKFFTFSDLRTPFTIRDDRLIMKTNKAELIVCFHIPDAAEIFIKGLFLNQQMEIADSRSRVVFNIEQVVAENVAVSASGNIEVLLQPMSPIVVSSKNKRGNYDYLSPEDNGYSELLINNLLNKYAASLNDLDIDYKPLKSPITITPVYFNQPPRHRLIAIKERTAAETKVKGYDKFKLRMQAPREVIELALNAGIGSYNAIGMGSVEVV